VCYQLPLCFVLVSLYLRLYLVLLCLFFFILLQSYLSNGNKKAPAYHIFLACKFFMGMGFLAYVQLQQGLLHGRKVGNTALGD